MTAFRSARLPEMSSSPKRISSWKLALLSSLISSLLLSSIIRIPRASFLRKVPAGNRGTPGAEIDGQWENSNPGPSG